MFFILCDDWKTLFLHKFVATHIYRYHHVSAFFETGVMKEVRMQCQLFPQYHYNAANTKVLR